MNKINRIKKNVIFSLIYQIISIIYGLIIPRLILEAFGSNINGLVSSLNQFLNYITLLEGGLTGVIMASLYKPLVENNMKKVSGIVKATESFFRKIAIIYIAYMLLVAILYPIFISTDYSWIFIFSLTCIIGITLFVQYFFSLSYRILINANEQGYIVFIVQIIFTVVNLIFTYIVVTKFPSIHMLKLANAIAYIIQPIVFRKYTKKTFNLDYDAEIDNTALSQRWDGFGQNLAYFIHTNTDIIVLTFFCTLSDVSIYSVYFLIATALKNIVMSVSSAIVPSIGKVLSESDTNLKNDVFDYYEFGVSYITTILFSCGISLVVPFILIYTGGIYDANYNQPIFGVLLLLAEAIYCFRDPYVSVAYASGHFKQTANYSYLEAAINIIISIIFVSRFGLIGVTIGTLISMIYRMLMHIYYLKVNILYRKMKYSLKNFILSMFSMVATYTLTSFFGLQLANTYYEWFFHAVITFALSLSIITLLNLLLNNRIIRKFYLKIFSK